MRPSILPNLIEAAGRNADRGVADAPLFEIGPQFAGDGPADQATVAAGVRSGLAEARTWGAAPRPADAFDAKADAVAALQAAGAPIDKLRVVAEAPRWYHPGRRGSLTLGPKTVLAHFGEVHPGVLHDMGVKGPIAGFEVFLDDLPPLKARKSTTRPMLHLPALQPVVRDFAFVVDQGVGAAQVVLAARSADKELIVEVKIFDVFQGQSLGEDRKSLALGVTLQPRDKTLTDAEIEAVSDRIVSAVVKATGGSLRA